MIRTLKAVIGIAYFSLWATQMLEAAAVPSSLNEERLDALRWFSAQGFRDVKDLRPVKVWTGGWSEVSAHKNEPNIEFGFLLHADGRNFSVVSTDLITHEYVQSDASVPDYQRVRFEEVSLDDIARDLLDPAVSRSRFHYHDEPSLQEKDSLFILGWCCWRNERFDLAASLLSKAEERKQLEGQDGGKPVRLRKAMVREIAAYQYQLALLDFGNPKISRSQLAETLEEFAARFPDERDSSYAKQLASALHDLLAEDKAHACDDNLDPSALVPEKRAGELLRRLRNQPYFPGKGNNPYTQLVELGDKAVPALIEALDDYRPTRFVVFHQMGSRGSGPDTGRLVSIGEAAEQVLSFILPHHFSERRENFPMVYFPSPTEPSKFKLEARSVWEEHQRKGAWQFMLDAIAKAGRRRIGRQTDWQEFAVAMEEALAKPSDKELIIRLA